MRSPWRLLLSGRANLRVVKISPWIDFAPRSDITVANDMFIGDFIGHAKSIAYAGK